MVSVLRAAGRSVRVGSTTVRVSRLADLTAQDYARWRRLEERAIEPYPQMTANYLETALEHRSDAADVTLLIGESQSEWVFLSVVTLSTLHPRLPVRVLTNLDDFMADEATRLYPLLHAERGARAIDDVMKGLAKLRLPGAIRFCAVDAEPALLAALAPRDGGAVVSIDMRRFARAIVRPGGAALPLPARSADTTPDFIPHERSAESRRKSGRLARRLQDHLGDEHPVVATRTQDPAIVDDFLAIQAGGWKGDAGRGGAGYVVTGRESWFRAFADRFMSEGRLRSFELRTSDRILYMTVCVQIGDRIFGLQDAYDETYSAQSLGSLSRRAVLNYVREHDIRFFDPNLSWFQFEPARAYPERTQQVELVLARRWSPYGLLLRAWARARSLRESVKSAADVQGAASA